MENTIKPQTPDRRHQKTRAGSSGVLLARVRVPSRAGLTPPPSAGGHRAISDPKSPWRENAAILKGEHRDGWDDGQVASAAEVQVGKRRVPRHEPSSSSADAVSILPSRLDEISSPVPGSAVLSALSDIRSANGAASRSTPVIFFFHEAHAPRCHPGASTAPVVFSDQVPILVVRMCPRDRIHNQDPGVW